MQALHPPGGLHTRPAWVGSTGVSTGVALRQRVQQRLRLLQVSGVKALGEPAVDWREEVMGFLVFALLLPETSETGRGAEFPGFCLLRTGYADGLLEAVLRFSLIICMLL